MAIEMLPVFTKEKTNLSDTISVGAINGWVGYFINITPIFSHKMDDLASFRMITSQIYHLGHCKQTEIASFFGVSERSVKRSYKKFLKTGSASFYSQPKPGRRKSGIFTPEFTDIIQEQFDEGRSKKEISLAYNLKIDTLNKAIRSGRLDEKKSTNQ